MEKFKRSDLNIKIPVEILELVDSSFNQKYKNNFVTHAKLKIFYVGETGDKRKFTEKFSEKLLSTLPLSPVVGYYNEEDEDFNAHNRTQYVYGFVPQNAEIELKDDGEKVWAYTDVILFTGRKDNIGEVAKKVIGSKHSLELDPDTVEYTINRDEEGNFLNVEFISAQFIGLSVVGESETPAFIGSGFFTEERKEEFLQAFATFTQLTTDMEKNSHVENGGGEDMNKFIELFGEDFLPKVLEFMKETYEERMVFIYEALTSQNPDQYLMPMQMDDETVVYYSYWENKHYRASYTIEENDGEKTVSFEEAVEVKARYLTEEEINNTFTEVTEEPVVEEPVVDEPEATEDSQEPQDKPDFTTSTVDETQNTVENIVTDEEPVVEEPVVEPEFTEEGASNAENQTTLSEDERKELEAFRKKEKEEIISKYSKFVPEKELESIKEKIDDFSTSELEKELSVYAMKALMAKEEEDQPSNFRVSRIMNTPIAEGQNLDPDVDLINKWK